MLTKKHDNAKWKNNVSPVRDRYNKTLIHVFYHCQNRKKYGKLWDHNYKFGLGK